MTNTPDELTERILKHVELALTKTFGTDVVLKSTEPDTARRYLAKAAATSDPIMAAGYRALAEEISEDV